MFDEAIEIIKNISVIVGFLISTFTLCSILIKPLRKKFIDKISELSYKEEQDKAIALNAKEIKEKTSLFEEAIRCEEIVTKDIREKVNQLVSMMSELSDRVFRNEADRLRSELFDCGNRCRRGIPLSGEEFRHIQGEYEKYANELHCNGIGREEYIFIKDYFNSKTNQEKLNKKYE